MDRNIEIKVFRLVYAWAQKNVTFVEDEWIHRCTENNISPDAVDEKWRMMTELWVGSDGADIWRQDPAIGEWLEGQGFIDLGELAEDHQLLYGED
tara:strand:+ start:352 stop:636 length:285 start_codon:yes stop_codon:yes gene_type:complete